jgi:hypothetical protein
MINNIFPKLRYCGKIRYSRTGHTWQYHTTHALWLLDNSGYRKREYVIPIACPWQQRLHKCASLLCYTYTACFVLCYLYHWVFPQWSQFPGNPDHPPSPYRPDDRDGATLLTWLMSVCVKQVPNPWLIAGNANRFLIWTVAISFGLYYQWDIQFYATDFGLHVSHNIKMHLYDSCCTGRATSIIHSASVFVAFNIQHALCMCHIVICDLSHYTTFFHTIS